MKNTWIPRILLLALFVILDYIITLSLISQPNQETNVLARNFMETFGIIPGLTLFSLLVNLPFFAILGLFTFFMARTSFATSSLVAPGLDILLAWFVAGTHFSGALSWMVNGSGVIYQLSGAALYLGILFVTSIRRGITQRN